MFDDLYPVVLDTGGQTVRKARVFQRDGMLRVYADTGRTVELVAAGELLDAERHPGRRWTLKVATDAGEQTWDIRRAAGCGCGSRLKRFTAEQAWA